jgi:hypothetical protein
MAEGCADDRLFSVCETIAVCDLQVMSLTTDRLRTTSYR